MFLTQQDPALKDCPRKLTTNLAHHEHHSVWFGLSVFIYIFPWSQWIRLGHSHISLAWSSGLLQYTV